MNLSIILLILSLANLCHGLKCYTCEDCENEYLKPTTCLNNQDRCLKFTANTYVYKQCAIQRLCTIEAFQQSLQNLWSKIVAVVNTDSRKDLEELGSTSDWVQCCDTDYCNGFDYNNPSLPLLILAAIAAIGIWKI